MSGINQTHPGRTEVEVSSATDEMKVRSEEVGGREGEFSWLS